MAYKDILVYLDASGDTTDRLRLAAELAKTHGARLIGVDASDESALVGAWGDAYPAQFEHWQARGWL